ncbi:denticleless protein homolog [Haliotis rufescens]|uniref:denticleless protein homolog n=1 Tax=Haliotis rufescens TaxID=6454 RepID=UPI00201E956E|nr:denticleless protein homolog [Haliotis rufescens]
MLFRSIYDRCEGRRKVRTQSVISPLLDQFESLTSDDYLLASEDDGVSVPPLACSFCPVASSSHILSLVDENGYLVLYNTLRTGTEAILTEWQAHNNAIFDLAWMESEEKIVTASGDQTAVLWDPHTSTKMEVFKGHTSSIRSVAFRKFDDAVLATGSRDGHVMLYDKRCAHKEGFIPPMNVIRNAHSVQGLKSKKRTKLGLVMDSQQSVTVVAFQSDMLLISSGAVDGCIKIWDLRKNYSSLNSDPVARYSFPYGGPRASKHGYSSLTVDSYGANLFASCTDDIIYQYDLVTYNKQPVNTFRGHQNHTFYVKSSISPDNDFLLSGSSDSMAYVWEIDKPNKSPVVLKGHRAEVTSVSWSKHDFTKLATLSDDNSMKLWRVLRRVKPPLFGEVAGTAERTHREIGTSTVPTAKETPKKPTCPVREYSPLSQPRSSPGGKSPSLGKSPSIKDWFKKQSFKENKPEGPVFSEQVHLQSPQKQTFHPSPRKASRLKLDEDEEDTGYFNGSSTVPFKAYVEKENSCSAKKTSKRKLDIGETNEQCKRRHIEQSSPAKSDMVLRDLEAELNNSEKASSCDIRSEGLKNSIIDKCANSEKGEVFSPTRNLPNLVVDEAENRQERLSVVMASPSQDKKCIDWLTQIRLGKHGHGRGIFPSPAKSVTSEDDMCGRSDCSSPGRSIIRTPVKGMKSILNYFQKSAEKKPRK